MGVAYLFCAWPPVRDLLSHGNSRTSLCYAAPGLPIQWAQRLKRVFAIDIETCEKCGGEVRNWYALQWRWDGLCHIRCFQTI
jgi:hypothetical protein